jgi:alpha-L-fucosidase
MNNSWGFNITDTSYKSVEELIHYLVNAAGRNANFLLNVGPMPNGKIQQEFVDTLQQIGKWLKDYGQTIYNTKGNIIAPQKWGVVTGKNKTLYVHIMEIPSQQPYIFIPDLKEKIISASSFSGKNKISFKQLPEGVFIYTNGLQHGAIDNIIQLNTQ